jgi:hypothetical protein
MTATACFRPARANGHAAEHHHISSHIVAAPDVQTSSKGSFADLCHKGKQT